jgi:hypothetical protein
VGQRVQALLAAQVPAEVERVRAAPATAVLPRRAKEVRVLELRALTKEGLAVARASKPVLRSRSSIQNGSRPKALTGRARRASPFQMDAASALAAQQHAAFILNNDATRFTWNRQHARMFNLQ